MILKGLNIGEGMSLRRSLRIGSTAEVLNMVLYTLVIKANNRWRNREGGIGGSEGLRVVAPYNQVKNTLRLHLRYLRIL